MLDTLYAAADRVRLEATTARAAHAATSLALSYDPDMLKVFADGWRYGRDPDLMSMNETTLAAIVDDAHARGKPVVTHTVTLEGAKVLVTGASSGIGAALAPMLAASGATVGIAARRTDRLSSSPTIVSSRR